MWTYNKTLQYPIKIKCRDPRLAKVIISQYGGAYGFCYYALYLSSKILSSLVKSILSIIM